MGAAGEQAEYRGCHSGDAFVQGLGELHAHAAALGRLLRVEHGHGAMTEHIGGRNRRAGVPGQPHRVGIAVVQAAVLRRAEAFGKRVPCRQPGYLVEEGWKRHMEGLSSLRVGTEVAEMMDAAGSGMP